MKPAPPPLQIEKPCPNQWDGMSGDAKRRFCEQCQLHVHNLSAMGEGERTKFIATTRESGHACVTYELRPDGTMVTPTRWSWVLRPLRAAAALLAAMLPFLFSACETRRTMGTPLPPDGKTATPAKPTTKIPRDASPAPLKPGLQIPGDVSPAPVKPGIQPPGRIRPQPVMGKVAMPATPSPSKSEPQE